MTQSSKESLPKIIVSGSSWARGEWVFGKPVVQHSGIVQYFTDAGYDVLPVSQARSYHSRVIEYLDKKLEEHYVENSVIFFIMADPLLDIIMPELASLKLKRTGDVTNLPMLTDKIKQAGGINNLIHQEQDSIYKQLDTVAKKYNATIHCIGGTYNLNTNILAKYTNLNPLVVSWLDLMVGHFQDYAHENISDPEFGITYTWTINYVDLSTYDSVFAEQVKQEFDTISKRFYILEEDIFHPDGLHPNRHGHKILYDKITQLLNL